MVVLSAAYKFTDKIATPVYIDQPTCGKTFDQRVHSCGCQSVVTSHRAIMLTAILFVLSAATIAQLAQAQDAGGPQLNSPRLFEPAQRALFSLPEDLKFNFAQQVCVRLSECGQVFRPRCPLAWLGRFSSLQRPHQTVHLTRLPRTS